MRLRNVCFQHATQAYLAGDKALAKNLSHQGRQHADAMKAAHQGKAVQVEPMTFMLKAPGLSSFNIKEN